MRFGMILMILLVFWIPVVSTEFSVGSDLRRQRRDINAPAEQQKQQVQMQVPSASSHPLTYNQQQHVNFGYAMRGRNPLITPNMQRNSKGFDSNQRWRKNSDADIGGLASSESTWGNQNEALNRVPPPIVQNSIRFVRDGLISSNPGTSVKDVPKDAWTDRDLLYDILHRKVQRKNGMVNAARMFMVNSELLNGVKKSRVSVVVIPDELLDKKQEEPYQPNSNFQKDHENNTGPVFSNPTPSPFPLLRNNSSYSYENVSDSLGFTPSVMKTAGNGSSFLGKSSQTPEITSLIGSTDMTVLSSTSHKTFVDIPTLPVSDDSDLLQIFQKDVARKELDADVVRRQINMDANETVNHDKEQSHQPVDYPYQWSKLEITSDYTGKNTEDDLKKMDVQNRIPAHISNHKSERAFTLDQEMIEKLQDMKPIVDIGADLEDDEASPRQRRYFRIGGLNSGLRRRFKWKKKHGREIAAATAEAVRDYEIN